MCVYQYVFSQNAIRIGKYVLLELHVSLCACNFSLLASLNSVFIFNQSEPTAESEEQFILLYLFTFIIWYVDRIIIFVNMLLRSYKNAHSMIFHADFQ